MNPPADASVQCAGDALELVGRAIDEAAGESVMLLVRDLEGLLALIEKNDDGTMPPVVETEEERLHAIINAATYFVTDALKGGKTKAEIRACCLEALAELEKVDS